MKKSSKTRELVPAVRAISFFRIAERSFRLRGREQPLWGWDRSFGFFVFGRKKVNQL